MTKKIRTLLLSLLVLSACGSSNAAAPTASAPTSSAEATENSSAEAPAVTLPLAESILDRALEVTGGADAYAGVKTYKIGGTFEIPAQKIVAQLEIVGSEGHQFAMNIVIPGLGTERSGGDGTTVWSTSAMTGARILTGPERDRSMRDADLLRDLNWKDYYKSATTTGLEDLAGKPTFVVAMVDTSGVAETRYYDKESGFLMRQTGTLKTQMGEMKSDSHFSNYKELGGLIMPATVRVEVMGMTQLLNIRTAEVNLTVPATAFALPAEIQALVDAATSK